MSNAFEINFDDVMMVLRKHNIEEHYDDIEVIFEQLDYDAVEKAALYFLEMENQTTSAYDEIENQLMQLGIIPKTNPKQYTCNGIVED